MNFESTQLAIVELFAGKNVRVSTDVELPSLRADIEERGLTTPLTVYFDEEKKKHEILCGHRRFTVITEIAKDDKDTFKRLFPKGKIPVLKVCGVSKERAQTLKVDGGTSVELKDPYETQLCANLMFDDGATDSAIANALSTQLCRTSRNGGMKKETRNSLKELAEKRQTARLAGDISKMRKLDKEMFKLRADYHRGHVQALRAVWACPHIVMACKEFQATQMVPAPFAGQKLVPLTNSNVSKLLRAFKDDLTVTDGNSIPKYTKERPGPSFNEAFKEIVDAVKAGGSTKVTRVKAMSSKDMRAEVETGKWSSKGFRSLTLSHAGDKVSGAVLKRLDKLAYTAEVIEEHDADAWANACAVFDEILAKLEKAAQKANNKKEKNS